MDYEIRNEQLLIKTEMPIKHLLEMEIHHEINAHASIQISAVVDKGDQSEILNKDWSGTKISVFKMEENEPLFRGFVEKIFFQMENQLLTIRISGIGETAILDRVKKKQSFQNIKITYKQVVDHLIKNYNGSEVVWNIDEEKAIGSPLVQYDETDWEFLMRLCSHFHGTLVADLRIGKTTILFGMRLGKERNGNKIEVLGSGFNSIYYQNGCYENEMPRSQAFFIEIETKENWQIGDSYLYEGKRFRVYRRNIMFKDGALSFFYRLGMQGTYYQKKIYNRKLQGLRLEGVIQETKGEKVYLQLDIDKEKRADYPWVWAPETNNLCYCMPELETKATLYFPSQEEKDGRVILSTVQNLKNSIYVDTQKREFVTKHHKKIGLYPNKIFMEGINGNVSVSLVDKQGVEIKSNTNISAVASGEIYLEGRNTKVVAPLEVVCRTMESNIELCRDINLYAPGGVKTVGTGNTVKKKKDTDRGNVTAGQEVEHWQASFSAIAAIPIVDFEKIQGEEDAVDLFACGSVPRIAQGSATIALSEVMTGKKASETSFPDAFISMDNYTVKGGYALPEE